MGQPQPSGTPFKNTFVSVGNVWNLKFVLLMQKCPKPRNVIKQGIWRVGDHHIKGYWSYPTLVDCPIHLTATLHI